MKKTLTLILALAIPLAVGAAAALLTGGGMADGVSQYHAVTQKRQANTTILTMLKTSLNIMATSFLKGDEVFL